MQPANDKVKAQVAYLCPCCRAALLQTQGFLAYNAALAKPFSAPTAAGLVGTSLTGPNTLTGPTPQPQNFLAEMEQVARDVTVTQQQLSRLF